jgi:hypothetical protein
MACVVLSDQVPLPETTSTLSWSYMAQAVRQQRLFCTQSLKLVCPFDRRTAVT